MALPQAFETYRFPRTDQADLTCIGLHIDGDIKAWWESALPFVTEKEHNHAKQFVHAIDGVRHMLGRAMVRRTLNATDGTPLTTEFAKTEWGKPYLPNASIDFSISHSGNMIWAAFCPKGSVGIDVERISPLPELSQMTNMLHPDENAAIRKGPIRERTSLFYRCWVRKEAVLKASGKGLSRPLDSVRVLTTQSETGWFQSIDGQLPEHWTAYDIPQPENYLCSVAATILTQDRETFFL